MTLRGWLDRLAASDRLAVKRPGVSLRFKRIRIPGKDRVDPAAVLDPRPVAQWRDVIG